MKTEVSSVNLAALEAFSASAGTSRGAPLAGRRTAYRVSAAHVACTACCCPLPACLVPH